MDMSGVQTIKQGGKPVFYVVPAALWERVRAVVEDAEAALQRARQGDHPIDRAAKLLGSQVALASALGVTKAAVGQWKIAGRRVPAQHCPLIERLTNGAVTCEELRPDVAWHIVRSPGAPAVPEKAEV